MKPLNTLLAVCMAIAALPAHAQVDPQRAQALALQALDHLDAGRYAEVEAMFGPDMAKAVPADKLRAVWESLPRQAGKATGRGEAEVSDQGGATMVQVPLQYEKASLVGKFAIDVEGRIVGFVVQPAGQPAAAKAAPVPADAAYAERALAVGPAERALPGTLAMPKGAGPFPAVVLVHGSGPQDRDETVGPNKPFMEIARGLAAQGIAVLRYEKRTRARPQDYAVGLAGVDDETTDDAVLAVEALRGTAGVDPARIFVLGHSQGGMMAPRIAAKSGQVAGLVLLAAPARPLLDIVIEQNHRLATLDDGKISETEQQVIDAVTGQVKAIRDPATDPANASLLGLPVGYWRSIDGVDPVAEARAAAKPMLLLQGGRDIQVVDADWERWKQAFGGQDKVEFRYYDALNHFGIAGEGPGSLAEYQVPGHVDAGLIGDVARWIKTH